MCIILLIFINITLKHLKEEGGGEALRHVLNKKYEFSKKYYLLI